MRKSTEKGLSLFIAVIALGLTGLTSPHLMKKQKLTFSNNLKNQDSIERLSDYERAQALKIDEVQYLSIKDYGRRDLASLSEAEKVKQEKSALSEDRSPAAISAQKETKALFNGFHNRQTVLFERAHIKTSEHLNGTHLED